jgi:hypothetical protein
MIAIIYHLKFVYLNDFLYGCRSHLYHEALVLVPISQRQLSCPYSFSALLRSRVRRVYTRIM